jgi:hypothetical protein
MQSFFRIPKKEKGQGLFIYVLFLLFLVMVVIVFMRALNPDGVNPTSGTVNVMNSLQDLTTSYIMQMS